MKAVIRNVSRTLIFAGGLTLAATAANAQMKIGTNPSVIEKSAILELNSNRQGLLLPRLPDFTAINTLIGASPVDGMIVYLASGVPATEGVYMRKAGVWVKISSAADAISNWSLLGNTTTDSLINYVGTTDMQALSLRANGTEGIRIETDGRLQFKNVLDNTSLLDVMVIDQVTGNVSRRTIPQTAFNSLFSNLATSASITNTTFGLVENATTGAVTINAPILDALNTTATYGFLSKADWDKLQALLTGNNFTVADFITTIAAGQENRGGRITFDVPTATYRLELVAASATLAGIVTTTTQTFGGDKTFANNVAVTGTLGVTGATTLDGATAINNTLNVTGATTLAGATATTLGVSGLSTLAATTATTLAVSGASTLTGAVTLGTVVPTATAASYDVLVKNTTTNEVEKKAFNLDALTTAVQFITTGAASTSGASVEFLTGTTGADFNVLADGTAKTVSFNLPDASAIDATHTAVQRGVVSANAQTFAGSKSFASKVSVGSIDTTTSTFQVTGSVAMSIKSVTGTYVITDADNTILADASGAGFTVTLPAPSSTVGSSNVGRIYTIKKVGNGDIDNPITLVSGGGANIEGGTTYMIYNDWTYITVQTDGAAWYIIKK